MIINHFRRKLQFSRDRLHSQTHAFINKHFDKLLIYNKSRFKLFKISKGSFQIIPMQVKVLNNALVQSPCSRQSSEILSVGCGIYGHKNIRYNTSSSVNCPFLYQGLVVCCIFKMDTISGSQFPLSQSCPNFRPVLRYTFAVWLLNTSSGRSKIIRYCQTYLGAVRHRKWPLNQAFAKTPSSNYYTSVPILNCPGHYFRCRSRALIKQYNQISLLP